MRGRADRPGLGTAALQLFGIAGFAVAQPLFDVLSRNSAFFVAHQAQPRDLVALTSIVLVAPAAAALACVGAARILARAAGWWALLAMIAIGVAAVALPPLVRLVGLPANAAAAAALAIGALAAALYARSPTLRSFATLLGAAPLVFAGLFLFTEPISRLVQGARDFRGVAARIQNDAPIVMLVLDELSTSTLVDRSGDVDAVRFPNLARLAREGSWYRNAHTVHTSTIHSLPAMLTGRYPQTDRLPWAADYPDSLFALLAGTYDMRVVESETMLWNDPDAREREPGVFRALVEDVAFVAAHVLLPEVWTAGLPSVTDAWGRFAKPRELNFAAFAQKGIWVGFRDRLARFRSFTSGIDACEHRCFHFLHIRLPHRPWNLLPSTRKYEPWTTQGLAEKEEWGDDVWRVDQAHQQHLLQVMATDSLIGELMARMREAGLWDRALFVVLADHGLGFWESESMRWMDGQTHPEDVIRVPLFVKRPGQREGETVDRPVSTIDVLPTIADVLGVELPWSVDGCRLDDAGCANEPGRIRRRVFDRYHQPIEIPDDLDERRASLERRLALFGSGSDSLFAFGPHRELVDRNVADFASSEASDYSLRFDRKAFASVEADPTNMTLARITGFLRPRDGSAAVPDERTIAAVVIDGVIRAIAPGYPHAAGSLLFSAIVPEQSVAPGTRTVSIYTIDTREPGETPTLRLAGERQVTIAAPRAAREEKTP